MPEENKCPKCGGWGAVVENEETFSYSDLDACSTCKGFGSHDDMIVAEAKRIFGAREIR